MEKAIEWQTYLYSGADTEEGREAFSEWLAQHEMHRKTFGKLEQLWQDLNYAAITEPSLDQEVEQIAEKNVRKTIWKQEWRNMAAIAASIMLCFIGWQVFSHYFHGKEQYITAVGEIKRIKLDDGSIMTLSGASSATVEYTDQERNVILEKGQAFFEVVRSPERKFNVIADQAKISVLGTAFDVQKSNLGIRVAVTKGVVKVNYQQASPRHLKKGEMVYSLNDKGLSPIQGFNQKELVSWRNGMLIYDNIPLIQVIEEVNRFRSKKITLANEELTSLPISIYLSISETDKLLSGLKLLDNVEVRENQQEIIIDKK